VYNYKITFEEYYEDYNSFDDCLKAFRIMLNDLSNDKDQIPLYFNFDEYDKEEEALHEHGYINRKGQEL